MKRIYFIQLFLFILILSACKSYNDDIDLSKVDIKFSISRFEQDLLSIEPIYLDDSIPKLQEKYQTFFPFFTEKLIRIGQVGDPEFLSYLNSFITSDIVIEAFKKVNVTFSSIKDLSNRLSNAFKRFHYYFPDRNIPRIYTFISGYNQSIAIADSTLAIGLERYLGADRLEYEALGIPKYLMRNMKPEKIPSDCMRAWAIGEFPFNDSIDNLANNMIYEGMLMYFTHKMLPDQPDSLIFGFTPDQIKWCKKNEKMMWAYLIENKLLFTTDSFTINKLINSAPFTSGFPQESPGRAVVWVGYRIVQSYLENNSEITLAILMNTIDYQHILNKSKYQP